MTEAGSMISENDFVKKFFHANMSRRKYAMGKRAEAMGATRRRILEATMEVHDEQGIVAARWPDIAERAGVSLATLYRHFPSLEELVTACGRLTVELVDPPSAETAADVFAGTRTRKQRVERLVDVTFAFYERAGRIVDNVRRDSSRLDALAQSHEQLEEGLQALAEEALRPFRSSRRDVALVRGLTDVRVWEALRERGLGADEVVETASQLILCALPSEGKGRRPRPKSPAAPA